MRRQLIIAVVAGVVVVGLFWIALIKPKLNEVSKVNGNIAAAAQEEQQLRLKLRQLQSAKSEAPATQAKLAKFDMLLPQTPDLPTFIREVQAAANADGVDLQSVSPSPPTALGTSSAVKSGIQTVTVNLQVQGGFFRMESFLARLEDLQRVVEVQNLAMAPSTDQLTGASTLQSTVTLTMFVVPPGAQAPQVKATTAQPSATPTPSPGASP